MENVENVKKTSGAAVPAIAQWKKAALMSKTVSAFKDTLSVDSEDDVDTKKQIKYGSKYQAAWAIFSEYCDNSTIHGVKYLGEQKRPCLERFFWILVFVFSIYTCASLILNIWDKWNNNPVIVSFAEKSTPVWQIPFPTVTICSETKTRSANFNFTDVYWRSIDFNNNNTVEELTDEETQNLFIVSQVCDAHLSDQLKHNESIIESLQMINVLSGLTTFFNDTYWTCKWRNILNDCDKLFQKYVTEEGICYSFNSLSPSEVYRSEGLIPDFILQTENRTATDWNVEDGYKFSADTETYPNRVLGPGSKAGLYMLLNGFDRDFDNLCRGPVQGFKVLLHTPGEVAQVSKQYFRIPFDQEVLISIKPKIITTSEGLKHYEPIRRQCFFQNERYLRYFHIYTQSNCELECLANSTITKCHCVRFSMPRHLNVPVCGISKLKCLNEAEDELFMKEFRDGIETSGENRRGKTDCNCLPSCTSIAYEAEISQADFDYKSISNTLTNSMADSRVARLSIFFKEAQFLTSRRSELYGTTDFLANCGGLLGLFMGVSTFSIVEIIYFCTVRLITNLKMRHNNRKIAASENFDAKTA